MLELDLLELVVEVVADLKEDHKVDMMGDLLLAPLCKCLALIHGFGQCKIRTYEPSNWPANKVML